LLIAIAWSEALFDFHAGWLITAGGRGLTYIWQDAAALLLVYKNHRKNFLIRRRMTLATIKQHLRSVSYDASPDLLLYDSWCDDGRVSGMPGEPTRAMVGSGSDKSSADNLRGACERRPK
jgi:hypothetical protein